MIKVTRIGHATFETPDVERQIAYFTDIVGLVLAERDGDRAFLSGFSRRGLRSRATIHRAGSGTGKPGTRKEASSVSKFRPA